LNDDTLMVGRLTRTYLLHIPPHLRAGQRYPFVIAFHSFGSNGQGFAGESGMSDVADRHGFVVVYPDGVNYGWNSGPRPKGVAPSDWSTADEVCFTAQLIDALAARLCLDPHRVYAAGRSLGGGMVHRLACDLATRIVAIAPLDGFYENVACHAARPVAVIAFHGTADVYHGSSAQGSPDIPTWARGWAQRDGCTRGPIGFFHHLNFSSQDISAVRYTACRAGTEVELYTIGDGGDVWPFDIVDAKGQSTIASELIWRFFAAHPRP
jgi:polyhydroxybutyrate depolymerase